MEDKAKTNNFKGRLIPVMPEAIGLFDIPLNKHLLYKELACSVLRSAPEGQRRTDNNKKEHICNFKNQNLFRKYKEFEQLEKELSLFCLKYIEQIGYLCDEVVFTDVWLNCGSVGATLPDHKHSNSFLSGTYYVDFNPDQHSNLSFVNDRNFLDGVFGPSIKLRINTLKRTDYNSSRLEFKCIEGQVLIWKSHLMHGFQNPNPKSNRVTLSFNVMPKVCSNANEYSFSVMS